MKKNILTLMIFMLLIGVTATACGTKDEIHLPGAIQFGVDRCEHCNMLVSEDFHATQIVLNDGRYLPFDDLGCMVEWSHEHGMENVNVRYVRDFNSGEWIVLHEATFVYSPEFQTPTPMDYGVYSFASENAANEFVAAHQIGQVLTFADLETHHWESGMIQGHHGDEHGEKDEHDEENHEEEKSHEKKTGH